MKRKIKVSLGNNKFQEPPGPEYPNLKDKKYNPNGDKGMSVCYMNADFKRTRMKNDNILKYNERRRQEKLKNDPYYEFRKNVDNAIDATPEIKRRMRWAEEDAKKNLS